MRWKGAGDGEREICVLIPYLEQMGDSDEFPFGACLVR